MTFIGEFYMPPDTDYFRDTTVSPLAGRQHYILFNAGKSRLRELPGWKEWDVSASIVTNLDDRSFVCVTDISRWFGTHFTSYVHLEVPHGSNTADFNSARYQTATSVGVRFHL